MICDSMYFEILGKIVDVEVIARGRGIRDRERLVRKYGLGNWRKMKGKAKVKLIDGSICWAEIHWYEAHGIGKKRFKIKHFLD
jgi:hypothetical protein